MSSVLCFLTLIFKPYICCLQRFAQSKCLNRISALRKCNEKTLFFCFKKSISISTHSVFHTVFLNFSKWPYQFSPDRINRSL